MSIAPTPTVLLDHQFADELTEMAIPWRAASATDPQLLVLNEPVARELGLDPVWLRGPDGLRLLTGNLLPAGAKPVAQAYAGHQFGGYSPRLGDGRALLLGEIRGDDGALRDLHLKGSGRTPFARGGDGLAVVGPMLREYIVSEAMHALGIPTTRSLAVVATGGLVQRETLLPGAVLARVASSHLRVGSFQYARATDNIDLLRRLADVAIVRHHPEAAHTEHPYRTLFDAVVARQASLVAKWMLIGFVHGVMNTDNMTISGESIDFGPCAFMEAFDPATVYSSIDTGGRYAYGNQPVVAEWNLARLAEAMLPLLDSDQEQAVAIAVESLGAFRRLYSADWSAGMRDKLGLSAGGNDSGNDSDTDDGNDSDTDDGNHSDDDATGGPLIADLISQLGQSHVDYTSFFRALGAAARGDAEPARGLFLDIVAFDSWLARWRALGPDADLMDRVNPIYIPRNHRVEEALSAATAGDLDPLFGLLSAVTRPFDEDPVLEQYAAPAPVDFGDYQTFCGT